MTNHSRTYRLRAGRLKSAALAVSLVLVIALSGCAPAGLSRAAAGGLTIGLSSEPGRLEAGADQGTAALFLSTLMHRGLVVYDRNGKIAPGLAQSYRKVSPTEYRFILRPGLRFHDGTPLTSASVRKTFRYLADPAHAARDFAALSTVKQVLTPSAREARVILKKPNAAFLEYLADPGASILPSSAFTKGAANHVGAGPFRLVKYNKGTSMTFEPFDGYYRSKGVKLKQIVLKFYADGQARTMALMNGDVDFIDYVPWENFAAIRRSENLVMSTQPGSFMYLNFNTNVTPLADPRVRRAIAYSIKRPNLVSSVFSGNGDTLGGPPIPQASPFYDKKIARTWTYNPKRARELLTEAGYPNGFSTSILTSSDYTFHQDTGLSVQADLAKVGIKLKVRAPDWTTRIAEGAKGKYGLSVNGTSGQVNDPAFLRELITGPANYRRSFGYHDPQMNSLLDRAQQELNPTTRKAMYRKVQQRFIDQAPIVTMSTREQGYAYSKNVHGFVNLPGFQSFVAGYTLDQASVEGG